MSDCTGMSESPTLSESPTNVPSTVFVERLLVSGQKLRESAVGRFAGNGNVLAIVQREDGCEITFTEQKIANDFINEGVQVGGQFYEVVDALDVNTQVTLKAVPYYIENDVLMAELQKAGFKLICEICKIAEYGIENGDRIVSIAGSDPGELPKIITIVAPNGRRDDIRLWWRNQK